MLDRVNNRLDSKSLIYEKRINNSTEHAINQLERDITDFFEKGGYTLDVFIDLSRAFDTVDQ